MKYITVTADTMVQRAGGFRILVIMVFATGRVPKIWRLSMQTGDLVAMRMTDTLWLVVMVISDTILVQNLKTGWRGWMNMSAFEVINESR